MHLKNFVSDDLWLKKRNSYQVNQQHERKVYESQNTSLFFLKLYSFPIRGNYTSQPFLFSPRRLQGEDGEFKLDTSSRVAEDKSVCPDPGSDRNTGKNVSIPDPAVPAVNADGSEQRENAIVF